MNEKIKMFAQTRDIIEQRITELKNRLSGVAQGLGSLDWDGDMMDEPLMMRLHDEHDQLNADRVRLQYYFGNAEIIDEKKARESRRVVLGSRVRLQVDSATDGLELMTIRVGSTIDRRFLGEVDGDIIFSTESPLVASILGKGANDQAEYSSASGNNRVKVLELLM